MYEGDTFFNLSPMGRTGLALLSIGLTIAVLGAFWKWSIRFGPVVKLLSAIAFFWLFVWLSPQAYYFYYLLIFDGLPLQSVVQSPPAPSEILALISFTGPQNLSAHGKGILFWLLILIALVHTLAWRQKRTADF